MSDPVGDDQHLRDSNSRHQKLDLQLNRLCHSLRITRDDVRYQKDSPAVTMNLSKIFAASEDLTTAVWCIPAPHVDYLLL